MALTPQNIFNASAAGNLRALDTGVTKTEIPGLGTVETYGRGIRWEKVEVLKDNSIITDKRDRFLKRNALVNGIAEAGNFEYALAVAPSVGGKRLAQCSFCNAHHNWVVFYRDLQGKYLGWSGTTCFGEIVRNLGLPAADAMIEQVKNERSRSEKFRKTMEKVNDFKRDFPNLYENREILGSGQNPYNRLWWAVRNRLNNAEGVTEKWLQSCLDGAYDRTRNSYDYDAKGWKVETDQTARRIPGFLRWASVKMREGVSINEVVKQLQEQKVQEDAEALARAKAAMAQKTPQPAPAAPAPKPAAPVTAPVDKDKLHGMAQALHHSGMYGWSRVVKQVLAGEEVNENAAKWLAREAANLPAYVSA